MVGRKSSTKLPGPSTQRCEVMRKQMIHPFHVPATKVTAPWYHLTPMPKPWAVWIVVETKRKRLWKMWKLWKIKSHIFPPSKEGNGNVKKWMHDGDLWPWTPLSHASFHQNKLFWEPHHNKHFTFHNPSSKPEYMGLYFGAFMVESNPTRDIPPSDICTVMILRTLFNSWVLITVPIGPFSAESTQRRC